MQPAVFGGLFFLHRICSFFKEARSMRWSKCAAMHVLVVGAGQMGSGIAQVCAAAGHTVLLHDIDDAAIARGRVAIKRGLGRLVEKGRLDERSEGDIQTRILDQAALDRRGYVGVGVSGGSGKTAL